MTPDYATWLTKQQAADAIGVTTKSVERFVQAGQIQQARWQRAGRGPLLAVYQPDDVARLAAERQPGPLPPCLVPGSAGAGNGNGKLHLPSATSGPDSTTLALAIPGGPVEVIAAFLQAVMSQTSQTPAVSETLYVTVKEAAGLLGLPQADVRRLIHTGDLPHRLTGRGGIRIRRKDLEAL